MNAEQLAEIIEERAEECIISAQVNQGTAGQVFHVVGIILKDLAAQIRKAE